MGGVLLELWNEVEELRDCEFIQKHNQEYEKIDQQDDLGLETLVIWSLAVFLLFSKDLHLVLDEVWFLLYC